jgi:hypothetical protein
VARRHDGQTFGYDELSRRVMNQKTGLAFGQNPYWEEYTHNDRSELEAVEYHPGAYPSGTADPNQTRAYAYDNIGNRDTFTLGQGPAITYTTNALNQYERWDRPSGPIAREWFTYDPAGKPDRVVRRRRHELRRGREFIGQRSVQ